MSEALTIECEWWGASEEKPKEAAEVCRAGIGIRLGDSWLTRLDDLRGNTVRNRMHGCAYTLGYWFASNWWRLRWEPESRSAKSDVDWRMTHSMAAAGGGFIWPNVLFASDGDSLAVVSRPTTPLSKETPIRYLNHVVGRTTAKDFERSVDEFMTLVLTRLHGEGVRNTELSQLWDVVGQERQDPESILWRRLEAICGYDPDEAPHAMIELLACDLFQLGRNAVEEVAAHSRHQTIEVLETIRDIGSKGKPAEGGFQCHPLTLAKLPTLTATQRPWEKARQLAHAARKEWGLGRGPLSNESLAEILKTNKKVFSRSDAMAGVPFPLGLRVSKGDALNVYIDRQPSTSRRFAASRLLGQWLASDGATERLIPAVDAKTGTQQFQRAFAQEFLCPFESLVDRLQTDRPTQEGMDEAADYFGVSPLMVRTTLVNKGELDRDALYWLN